MFGVNLTTSADPNADPVALATLAEGLGFDFVSCSDHPCGEQATNETWTLLTWVAARTTRIGIVTRLSNTKEVQDTQTDGRRNRSHRPQSFTARQIRDRHRCRD